MIAECLLSFPFLDPQASHSSTHAHSRLRFIGRGPSINVWLRWNTREFMIHGFFVSPILGSSFVRVILPSKAPPTSNPCLQRNAINLSVGCRPRPLQKHSYVGVLPNCSIASTDSQRIAITAVLGSSTILPSSTLRHSGTFARSPRSSVSSVLHHGHSCALGS